MHNRFLPILTLCACLLSACKNEPDAETPSAEVYAAYVKAFTGGIVADNAGIRVVVTDVPGSLPPGENLFSFKPSVDGITVRSGNSFSFVPEPGALKAGQTYRVSFALGKVFGPDAPQTFDFGLSVRGKGVAAEEEEEDGTGFYVRKATQYEDRVEVLLSEAPQNAQVKGMVRLEGAARSYVQTAGNLVRIYYEQPQDDLTLTLSEEREL